MTAGDRTSQVAGPPPGGMRLSGPLPASGGGRTVTFSGSLLEEPPAAVPAPAPSPETAPAPAPRPPLLVLAARRFAATDPERADARLLMATFRRSTIYLQSTAAAVRLEGGVWLPVFSTPEYLAAFSQATGALDAEGAADYVALPGERLLEHYLTAGTGMVLDALTDHMLLMPAQLPEEDSDA